jgi:hypothetical protein
VQQLIFEIALPDELYAELLAGCRDCQCPPKVFAEEAILSVLASRRLPRVLVEQLERGGPLKGPRMCGSDSHADFVEHRILLPEKG